MTDSDRNHGGGQPSLAAGMALLVLAAVLIVVVLIKPDMAGWLKTIIAVLAILVVVTLLIFAFRVFVISRRDGRK